MLMERSFFIAWWILVEQREGRIFGPAISVNKKKPDRCFHLKDVKPFWSLILFLNAQGITFVKGVRNTSYLF